MKACSVVSAIGASLALALACAGAPQKPEPEAPGPPPERETRAPDDVREEEQPLKPRLPEHEVVQNVSVSPKAKEVVAATDRSASDRELDPGRKPAELLSFCGIEPGMRVAELGAGRGYTAELLARVVGASGKVYGQNTPFILERFAEGPWKERLEKPVMKPVERLDTEFDAPLEGVSDLDAVLLVLFYHDTVWMETDRAAMNQGIRDALKPGGTYCVVDHAAAEGHGVRDAKTLHRIEQSVVEAEIARAGFSLEAEASFLRNPDDARDWNAAPSAAGDRRGTSDRFVLRFRKP